MRAFYLFLLILISACTKASDYAAETGGEINPRAVTIKNYKDTLKLFDELGYTQEQWQAGVREIPRVYLSNIPDRWSKKTANKITIQLKKELFFRAISPLALRSNELILLQRERLEKLIANQGPLSSSDQKWLAKLAEKYRLEAASFSSSDELLQALLPRVDIIPASLILAQAAEESGWGTSRFAYTGNALFGQWTWGDNGVRPEQQREGKGDYKIAAFAAPLQSVQSHARNLNTNSAYLQFRIKRAQMRINDNPINGFNLAGALTSYSERGQEYVKTLRSIISYNNLQATDDAYFNDQQAIVLVQEN